MRDIKDILKAWANSRVMTRIGTEYPSHAATLQGAKRSFDYRQFLTEDEADVVDSALLLLKQIDIAQYLILRETYLNKRSVRNIRDHCGISYADVTKRLMQAEYFIYGYIFNHFYP